MTRPTIAGCFLFALFLSSLGCKKEDDTYSVGNKDGVALSNVLAFTAVTPVQLDADSASISTLTVKVDPEATAASKAVKFHTDGGKFSNGDTTQTVEANSEGYASAYLLSDTPRNAHIRVSVMDTYTLDTVVTFVPALPDDMLLAPDKYVGDTTASFIMTSSLFRNAQRGKVSGHIKVVFLVEPVDTSVNLVYPPFAFTNGSDATVTLSNPYKAAGRFNVTTKALSSHGDSLSRTIQIKITK